MMIQLHFLNYHNSDGDMSPATTSHWTVRHFIGAYALQFMESLGSTSLLNEAIIGCLDPIFFLFFFALINLKAFNLLSTLER